MWKEKEEKVQGLVFAILWLFIGVTSALDLALTVKYASVIEEQNPIGKWILSAQGISEFVFAKMVGTILVLGILVFLQKKWSAAAQLVITGLALFQLGLMVYLFS